VKIWNQLVKKVKKKYGFSDKTQGVQT